MNGRLLERNAHHFALTELGQEYYQRCAPLLAELQEVHRQLGDQYQRLCGRLRVTAPMAVTQNWLGQCFNQFMRRYPGIELELRLSNQYEDLVGQHMDAALRVGEPRDSSWVARPVWTSRVALCAAPGYLAQAGMPEHPRDLHDHALIASFLLREWWLEEQHSGETYRFNPQARLRVDDISMALEAARDGSASPCSRTTFSSIGTAWLMAFRRCYQAGKVSNVRFISITATGTRCRPGCALSSTSCWPGWNRKTHRPVERVDAIAMGSVKSNQAP